MKWPYWIALFLAPTASHAACALHDRRLRDALRSSRSGACCGPIRPPQAVTARDVLEYLQHLRRERGNGDAAVNRQLTILRSFYRAIVAMGHLDPDANPMAGFPIVKAVPRKLPVTLDLEQVSRLLAGPHADTVIGLRDRALLALLYGTGIRASECSSLSSGQVDLRALTITVHGKGGHERTIPLNPQVADVLHDYVSARGPALPTAPFFRSRFGRPLSRGAVYERVRTWGSAVALAFHSHRIACATRSPRTWCAPASASSPSATCSGIDRSPARRSICT